MITNTLQPKKGFALLLTLVVASVVLAIGLSLLSITLKQLTLSSTARDSEIAFHTANIGIEAAQRAVLKNADNFFAHSASAPILPAPLDNTNGDGFDSLAREADPKEGSEEFGHADNDVTQYRYEFTNDTDGRCVQISIYVLGDLNNGVNNDLNVNITNTFGEVEGLETATCNDGNKCTYVFSRGYNRACGDLTSIRTIQRELTLIF